jgi:hypothetical protein
MDRRIMERPKRIEAGRVGGGWEEDMLPLKKKKKLPSII